MEDLKEKYESLLASIVVMAERIGELEKKVRKLERKSNTK